MLLLLLLPPLVLSFALLAKLTNIRQTPPLLLATLTLSLSIPLSIVFLIPIDLIPSSSQTTTLATIWKCIYWTSFFLTMFALPFAQYYIASGEFQPIARVKHALRQLGLYMAVFAGITLATLAYFRNWQTLSSILVSLSQLSSLLFSIVCLVHGLLDIPYTVIPRSYETKLSTAYKQLPPLEYSLKDSEIDLHDTYLKIKALATTADANSDFRDNIIYLDSQIPDSFKIPRQHLLNDYLDTSLSVYQLHENLKFYTWKYLHAKTNFNNKLLETLYYEDVLSHISDEQSLPRLWRTKHWKLPPAYYKYDVPLLSSFAFIITTLLAIMIIQSEVFHSTKLSLLALATSTTSSNSITLALMPLLLYMMSTSISSISKINLFSIYQVSFNSNSDPVSTIFFTSYTIRLTIPLGYNFITLLNPQSTPAPPTFLQFVESNLSHVPLATFLNATIPRLSIVLVALSLLGTWSSLNTWITQTFGAFWNDNDGDGDMDTNDELTGKSIALRWESYGVAAWSAEL